MSRQLAQRLVVVAALLLLTGAAGMAATGCIPYRVLQPLGEWVRRPQDVTPERYRRFLQACWFLAAWMTALGTGLFLARSRAARWLQSVGEEIASQLAIPFRTRIEGTLDAWLVIAIGIALRFVRLNQPMAYDEAYTYLNFARRPWYEGIADYNSTNNHLLNTFCMHWADRLFGNSEWALRLPVFLAGCLTLPMTYRWARRWVGRHAALVTMALVAASPMMITYSTDARGYMFVAAAALLIDDAAATLDRHYGEKQLAWLWIVLAAVLGLWAMPIMLYPIASTATWFLAASCLTRGGLNRTAGANTGQFRRRLQATLIAAAVGILLVAIGYMPAYVFRGTLFLHDPIMQRAAQGDFAPELASSIAGAWQWWTAGPLPRGLWGAALAAGLCLWRPLARDAVRLAAPFVVMLALTALQHVAPPPRIYLMLFPWLALIAAQGAVTTLGMAVRRLRVAHSANGTSDPDGVRILSAAICAAGCWYVGSHPVLFDARDRSAYRSIRDAMRSLQREIEVEPVVRQRLYAPLPCDLPALFYRERAGMNVEINGLPGPEERLWLIAVDADTPLEVLKSPLINLDLPSEELGPWTRVETFETLTLYRSDRVLQTNPAQNEGHF